jgi:hypothetical protein
MALPENHPLSEFPCFCHTASCAATPIAAHVVAPFKGDIVKLWTALGGAITVADCTVTPAINGTAITGGAITIATASSAAGDIDFAVPTALFSVNEGDVITFTPAGATGTNIPLNCCAVIRRT